MNIRKIAAFVLAASFVGGTVLAETVTVTASRLYLREMPSASGSVRRVLENGEEAELLSEENGWTKVVYQGETGYLSSEYLSKSGTAAPVQPQSPAIVVPDVPNTTPAAQESGYSAAKDAKTTTRVNVREKATTDSGILTVLDGGASVKVTGESGSWYAVTVSAGSGFISKSYVTFNTASPVTPAVNPEASSADVTYSATALGRVTTNVHLRSKASQYSDSLDIIYEGMSFSVTGESGTWYTVNAGGKRGYIAKKYVELIAAEVKSDTPAAEQTAGGDDYSAFDKELEGTLTTQVNLRSGPGTEYSRILIMNGGAKLKVYGTVGEWYKVSYNGEEGYASKNYVKTEAVKAPEEKKETSSYEQWTGVANVSVNLRAEPEGDILMVLQEGSEVTVTGEKGSWYQVQYKNYTGYAAATYIKKQGETVVKPSDEKVEIKVDPAASGVYAYVTGTSVYIREGAGTTYSAVTTLGSRTRITVYEETNGFYRMSYGTLNGYISAKYVSLTDDVPTGDDEPAVQGGSVKNADWWKSDIQSIFSVGTVATVTDVNSGISFQVKRTGGLSHADSQPLTPADTALMYQAYNNKWAWDRHAIWVTVGGTTYAASMNGMPHESGNDSMPYNNFDGCFCIHFLNSRTHTGDRLDSAHQSCVKEAYSAGN